MKQKQQTKVMINVEECGKGIANYKEQGVDRKIYDCKARGTGEDQKKFKCDGTFEGTQPCKIEKCGCAKYGCGGLPLIGKCGKCGRLNHICPFCNREDRVLSVQDANPAKHTKESTEFDAHVSRWHDEFLIETPVPIQEAVGGLDLLAAAVELVVKQNTDLVPATEVKTVATTTVNTIVVPTTAVETNTVSGKRPAGSETKTTSQTPTKKANVRSNTPTTTTTTTTSIATAAKAEDTTKMTTATPLSSHERRLKSISGWDQFPVISLNDKLCYARDLINLKRYWNEKDFKKIFDVSVAFKDGFLEQDQVLVISFYQIQGSDDLVNCLFVLLHEIFTLDTGVKNYLEDEQCKYTGMMKSIMQTDGLGCITIGIKIDDLEVRPPGPIEMMVDYNGLTGLSRSVLNCLFNHVKMDDYIFDAEHALTNIVWDTGFQFGFIETKPSQVFPIENGEKVEYSPDDPAMNSRYHVLFIVLLYHVQILRVTAPAVGANLQFDTQALQLQVAIYPARVLMMPLNKSVLSTHSMVLGFVNLWTVRADPNKYIGDYYDKKSRKHALSLELPKMVKAARMYTKVIRNKGKWTAVCSSDEQIKFMNHEQKRQFSLKCFDMSLSCHETERVVTNEIHNQLVLPVEDINMEDKPIQTIFACQEGLNLSIYKFDN